MGGGHLLLGLGVSATAAWGGSGGSRRREGRAPCARETVHLVWGAGREGKGGLGAGLYSVETGQVPAGGDGPASLPDDRFLW